MYINILIVLLFNYEYLNFQPRMYTERLMLSVGPVIYLQISSFWARKSSTILQITT